MPLWLIVLLAALALLAFFVASALLARRRVRREDLAMDAANFHEADAALQRLADEQGWTLELRPSVHFWYRLKGTGPHKIAWEIVEAPPQLMNGAAVGPGARWSTNDVKAFQLLIEVLPVGLHRHMVEALTHGGWDASWSQATRKLLQNGQVVKIPHLALNNTHVMVTSAKNLANSMFSLAMGDKFAALPPSSARLSLGFPNLRLSSDESATTAGFLPLLVAAGCEAAHRALTVPVAEGDIDNL